MIFSLQQFNPVSVSLPTVEYHVQKPCMSGDVDSWYILIVSISVVFLDVNPEQILHEGEEPEFDSVPDLEELVLVDIFEIPLEEFLRDEVDNKQQVLDTSFDDSHLDHPDTSQQCADQAVQFVQNAFLTLSHDVTDCSEVGVD